jgi:hypothetical protein
LIRLAAMIGCLWANQTVFCAGAAATNEAELKYEAPLTVSGAIYPKGSTNETPLFNFKRHATRSGEMLTVLREFTYPDGRLAVRQRLVYDGDDLVSIEHEDLQTGARGSAVIRRALNNPAKRLVEFEYTKDASSGAKPKTSEEPLRDDTLTDDMIGVFLQSHWEAISNGRAVKCRYLVVSRRQTVGFTFVRISESTFDGLPVVIVKMEATSILVSALVNPLFFTVEKDAPHRTLQYIGRTEPKLHAGTKWTELDAVTVFGWK